MKKYCIVNGDDFGASTGINRGIVKAHREGVLTSTSLMVNMSGAEEAARLSLKIPKMSVGLHIVLTNETWEPLINFDSKDECMDELERQWDRFSELTGGTPTHLDAHHNIYRDNRLTSIFVEWAKRKNIPLREHSRVRYFSEFYGQWDGESHLEQISEDSLCQMLRTKITDKYTEISCHPGYVEKDYITAYSIERETELRTLCSPLIRETFDELGIELINYSDFNKMADSERKVLK